MTAMTVVYDSVDVDADADVDGNDDGVDGSDDDGDVDGDDDTKDDAYDDHVDFVDDQCHSVLPRDAHLARLVCAWISAWNCRLGGQSSALLSNALNIICVAP